MSSSRNSPTADPSILGNAAGEVRAIFNVLAKFRDGPDPDQTGEFIAVFEDLEIAGLVTGWPMWPRQSVSSNPSCTLSSVK